MISCPISELKKNLGIAREAVFRSGNFLSKAQKKSRKIKIDFRRDVKIAADMESEAIIVGFLKKESSFSMLSEESGLLLRFNTDKPQWIIDPLDGSFNFYRGIPISCVSIGLWKNETPLLGAIYDFNKTELFSGIANIGSWLNNQKIHVSNIRRKRKAVLLTGLPSKTDFSSRTLAPFVNDMRSYKKVRFLGSAALSLAYVASARADVYFEKNIMIWDIAAGVPIITGAGGRCHIESLSDKETFLVYASNRFLSKNRY